MASDAGGNRFLIITLLLATGILAYYYWDASGATSSLLREIERLSRDSTNANKSISAMRSELDACKAQMKVLEDEKNKVKGESDAKDKEIADKKAAEDKAQEEIKKLTTERAEFEKQANESKSQIETCKKDCEEKINAAKQECSSKSAVPAAAAAAPAAAAAAAPAAAPNPGAAQ